MNIQLTHGNFVMDFQVDKNENLNLRYLGSGVAPLPDEEFRPAVELCLSPGGGDFGKCTWMDGVQLHYQSHEDVTEGSVRRVNFTLVGADLQVTLTYLFYPGVNGFRCRTTVQNVGDKPRMLYYLSGFHYCCLPSDTESKLTWCRNGWGQEVQPRTATLRELGLEALNWTTSTHFVIENQGTFSTKDYLPMGYLDGILWQIEQNGPWRFELGDSMGKYYLSLAGSSEKSGWKRRLLPGQVCESPWCAVTVGKDMDAAVAEMTRYRRYVKGVNEPFAAQPVIFNDYMHCIVTHPHTENEHEMMEWAAKSGAEYYCMDAGWYATGGWWNTVGDWMPAEERFSAGFAEVFDYARSLGLTPGLWLEPEVMGVDCYLAKEWPDECFYLRDGVRVVNRGRYQLDFRHEIVRRHMDATIDRLVTQHGIGYFKFDYNIDAGQGTDYLADSVGDGLERCLAAYYDWIDGIRARHPHVILENCSSGGLRMNYAQLSRFCLQSTSDNESFKETAVIAANAPFALLPEQAGVWVCPLEGMKENELVYTLLNGMTGVFYLAGRPDLQGENFPLITQAVEVYKSYRSELCGVEPFWPLGFNRFDEDRYCLAYRSGRKVYLFLWQRKGTGAFELNIPAKSCKCIFPRKNDYRVKVGDTLTVELGDDLAAGLFVIED